MVTGMTGDRARSALSGTRFADLRWVPETGSTNLDLLELARSGAPEGVVLVADHQTAGRGRLDRTWEAPPGSSLLVSILLRPELEPAHVFAATMAVGVSAVEATREVAGLVPSLKWPNDLIVTRSEDDRATVRKLGGMLTESVVEGDRIAALVVGIGINVNWPDTPPPDLADIATALNHEVGAEVDREDLLVAILERLEARCTSLGEAGSRAELHVDYLTHCATVGRRVRAELPAESVEGVAVDVSPEGHLIIETDAGDPREIVAGDVVHLR
jgi:BirA family biotin operon repressor/biotin-[acetyl-CoA-carboxylase] ligase